MRYADDFVVLVRASRARELVDWIEAKLETWMGLEINRDKTRLVELKQEEASLDFLGSHVSLRLGSPGKCHSGISI